MIKANFIIICDKAELSENQKLNINGVFDSIYSKDFPAINPSFAIVVHMEIGKGMKGNHVEVIKIKKNGNVIFTSREHKFQAVNDRHQIINNLHNLMLPEEGKYVVEIYIDEELIGSNYFLAKKR